MRERQPDLSQGPCRNLISAVNRLCCCSTFCLRVFFVVVVVAVAWPICRWVYERHDPVATLCVSFIGHLSIHYLIYCPLLHRICTREAGLGEVRGGGCFYATIFGLVMRTNFTAGLGGYYSHSLAPRTRFGTTKAGRNSTLHTPRFVEKKTKNGWWSSAGLVLSFAVASGI